MADIYILQKDLPNAKAGDKYWYKNSGGSYAYFKNGNIYDPSWFCVEYVRDNPTWFLQEVNKPDWEILSFVHGGNDFFTKSHDGNWRSSTSSHAWMEIELIKNKNPINSVRRLSDGEVFTRGDLISWANCPITKIKGFEISPRNGNMIILYDEGHGVGINTIKNIKSEKELPIKVIAFYRECDSIN